MSLWRYAFVHRLLQPGLPRQQLTSQKDLHPVTLTACPRFSFCAGVIAGAVMGAVGGLALILAATWLIRHCKHRRSRRSKSTWEDRDALGPLYTVGSAKDPSSRFFPQIVHSPSSKHSGRTAAAAAAPAPAAAGDVAPVLDTGRGAMALGFTGDELQAGLSDLKHVVTNRLLPAVDSSPLQTGTMALRSGVRTTSRLALSVEQACPPLHLAHGG